MGPLSMTMLSQRSRHQRRSACNRCRTYKLRCERDPRQAEGVCERCRKSGAACTTATTATATAATSSPMSTAVDANKGFSTGTRPAIPLAPAPRGASSSHDVPRPVQQIQPARDTVNVARTENTRANPPAAVLEEGRTSVSHPQL